jgi:hypothetical protein
MKDEKSPSLIHPSSFRLPPYRVRGLFYGTQAAQSRFHAVFISIAYNRVRGLEGPV